MIIVIVVVIVRVAYQHQFGSEPTIIPEKLWFWLLVLVARYSGGCGTGAVGKPRLVVAH